MRTASYEVFNSRDSIIMHSLDIVQQVVGLGLLIACMHMHMHKHYFGFHCELSECKI